MLTIIENDRFSPLGINLPVFRRSSPYFVILCYQASARGEADGDAKMP